MSIRLMETEYSRYIHQIKLNEIGIDGQQRLKNARVLCIGAGGLGTPLLLYLAAAGVGTLGIMDADKIELSNLHRQILYEHTHIGNHKVVSAQQQLHALNSHVSIKTYPTNFDIHSEEIIKDYDIIADCSDNFVTRYLINDTCFKQGKPFASASVAEFAGLCTTFLGNQGPCYRCLFPAASHAPIPNCNGTGIVGVVSGLLGIIQASEIIKWILQVGDLLVGRVLTVDLLKMQFRHFELLPIPDCEVCGAYRMIPPATFPIRSEKGNSMINDYVITVKELKELLQKNADIQLIDVRTAEKHQAFNIGGKLIPMDELPQRLNELQPEKLIVTYCTSGGRSMNALKLLLDLGITNVKSLAGGMTAWQAEGESQCHS